MNLFDFGKPIEPMQVDEKPYELDFKYIESDKISDIVSKIEANKFYQSTIFYGEFGANNLDFIKSIILRLIRSSYAETNSEKIFINKSHPDIMIVDKNPILIDDVRSVHEFLNTKPSVMNHKIIGINNIENMNIASYNAMLKILEEPRSDVYFLITSLNINNIIQTIKSRCILMNVSNMENDGHKCAYGDRCIVRDVRKYFKYCDDNNINMVYDNIETAFKIGYVNFDIKQIPIYIIIYCFDLYISNFYAKSSDEIKIKLSQIIKNYKENVVQNALYNTNIEVILNNLIMKIKTI